jgi:hypothetical protein
MSRYLKKLNFTLIDIIWSLSLSSILFSCQSKHKNKVQLSNPKEVKFEFLDSIVVETIDFLFLADKNEKTQQFVFNTKEIKELLITDLHGTIQSKFELTGDGPDQVTSPLEVAFWKDGFVIKEISPTHNFHFFNKDFKKIAQSPKITEGLNFLTIYNSHRSFSVIENEGRNFIIGEDLNLIEENLISEYEENADLYEKAVTGYSYDEEKEKITRFNIYPKTWKPRMEKKWVGSIPSFLQVSKSNKVIVVLPSVGDELFYYDWEPNSISPIFQISLDHTERKIKSSYNPKNDYVLYPHFTQLFSGGKYFLVEFFTALPSEVYDSFRSKSEDFQMNPDYWAALEEYRQVKYILTDQNGNQGPVSKLPIQGQIHYMDADDNVYIKPTLEKELDYNVFYRYKIRLDDSKL